MHGFHRIAGVWLKFHVFVRGCVRGICTRSNDLKMLDRYFMYFHGAVRGVFAWSLLGVNFTYVYEALRSVFAWLPIDLKIPERYFMCVHVAQLGICMASNRSEDS